MLTYSFFCYYTSIEGNYHSQFGKYGIPLMGKNIIIFLNKTFQVRVFEEIHMTEFYLNKCW